MPLEVTLPPEPQEVEILAADEWLQNLDLDWQDAIAADPTPGLSTIPDDPIQAPSLMPGELMQLERRALTLEDLPAPRKGCSCEDHEHLYRDWPVQNAELTIGTCMKECPYCGYNHDRPAELRKPIKSAHWRRNIIVHKEKMGDKHVIPGWKPIPPPSAPIIQSTVTINQV